MVLIAVACGSVASGMEGSKVQATLSDRTPEPGEVVRLDAICDCEATGATATVFGEHVSLFPTGDGRLWSGLIGVDLAVEPGTYPLTIVVEHVEPGPIAATEELSVVAKRFAVRRLRVPARFVEAPGEREDPGRVAPTRNALSHRDATSPVASSVSGASQHA
jgi:hypothetical protein